MLTSAKWRFVDWICLVISLIYNKNKNKTGPNTEPWGTPEGSRTRVTAIKRHHLEAIAYERFDPCCSLSSNSMTIIKF